MHWTRRISRAASAVASLALATACVGDFGVGLCSQGCSLDFHEFTLNLTGAVTAAADGSPLPGVTVSTLGTGGVREGGEVLTDSLGRYSLTAELNCLVVRGVCPAWHLFVAHLDGFDRGLEPRSLDLDGKDVTAPVLDATLDFGLRSTRPITVVIYGQVTEGQGAKPVAEARITSRDGLYPTLARTDSTTTDSLGEYRIVASDHCAVIGSSCLASFTVRASEDGGSLEIQDRLNIDVPGDTAVLEIDFANLR